MVDGIVVGGNTDGERQVLHLSRANRHGLIAGATGTGKTVTLQGFVEGLSAAGVPSFVADVKGDLAGLAMPGSATARTHGAFAQRAAELGLPDWRYAACPVQFWDLFGRQGHPVRTTVTEMGPLLLARLMELTPAQEGVLAIAFRVADEEGLPLIDLDDLQAMLAACAARAGELSAHYGNVTKPSVGAIQRQLLQLRTQGGDRFFGEPALVLQDLIVTDDRGRGVVNILAADALMASPRLYATFLLWLLSELFEQMPEIGDADRPRLVLFFDEAHLLFEDAPDALVDKVEQVVRLIRSKGVGVYFITQNPIDVPDRIAGQLGNRIQHALRAFTPRDQAAVKAAAQSFRAAPGLDVTTAIGELKVGEALVSLLQPDGAPAPVARTLIAPPASRVGPLTGEERAVIMQTDAIGDKYDVAIDRDSADEMLAARAADAAAAAQGPEPARPRAGTRAQASSWDAAMTSAARAASSSLGRQVANEIGRELLGTGRGRRRAQSGGGLLGSVVRGVLGGLFRGR